MKPSVIGIVEILHHATLKHPVPAYPLQATGDLVNHRAPFTPAAVEFDHRIPFGTDTPIRVLRRRQPILQREIILGAVEPVCGELLIIT